jgi:hypothetical protein
MPLKLLRLYALLFITAFCIAIFVLGLMTKVTFFKTFIGPAVILLYIAFKPNFYYDIIAVSTILLLTVIALIFSVVSALVNHEYALAFFVPFIPIATLTVIVYCMDKLKKENELYS